MNGIHSVNTRRGGAPRSSLLIQNRQPIDCTLTPALQRSGRARTSEPNAKREEYPRNKHTERMLNTYPIEIETEAHGTPGPCGETATASARSPLPPPTHPLAQRSSARIVLCRPEREAADERELRRRDRRWEEEERDPHRRDTTPGRARRGRGGGAAGLPAAARAPADAPAARRNAPRAREEGLADHRRRGGRELREEVHRADERG
jgi:hypothetical protein